MEIAQIHVFVLIVFSFKSGRPWCTKSIQKGQDYSGVNEAFFKIDYSVQEEALTTLGKYQKRS